MTEKCTHGVRFGTLCAWCGADVGQLTDSIAFPTSRSIVFSEKEVKNVVSDHVGNMKKCKKLSILIHMDQIILDTKLLSSSSEISIGQKSDKDDSDDTTFTANTSPPYLVRLRPHLHEFLLKLHEFFEMTLFTLNKHELAAKILEHIDPDNRFFNTRIMAPNSMIERNISKTYYDSTNLMVILDVSSQSWKDSNGLPVEGFVEISPFAFFEETRPRAPLFPILPPFLANYFSQKSDNVLPNIAKMLLKVHEEFFSKSDYDYTLLDTLQNVQSSVLSGCCICISETLCPPHDKKFIKYLSKYGAQVFDKYNSCVTHVIAENADCPFVKEALEYKGVLAVTFVWLIDSCINYRKMDEMCYPITGVESPTKGQKEIDNPQSDKDLSSSEFERMIDDSDEGDITTSSSEEEVNDTSSKVKKVRTFEIEK